MRLPNSRSRTFLLSAALFAFTFVVYALTTSLSYLHIDVHSAGLASWRIANTGEPWMEDVDIDATGIPSERAFLGEGADSRLVVHRSPGVVAAGIPAYWLAAQLGYVDGFSRVPSAVTAVVLAAFTVLLFYLCISRLVGRPIGIASSAVFAFTTPMWSVAGNSLWTHTVTGVAIAGMAWAADRQRWWLVGVFGGVGLWGRLHVAVIVAILGLGIAVLRREPRIALMIGAVSGAFVGLASVWSHWMYGSWSPSGGYSGSGYLSNLEGGAADGTWGQIANHLGMWIAPDRGMLVWTPLLLLLVPAVVRSWHDLPDWSRCLAVGGLVYIGIQGQLNLFMGGDGYYGYRLQLELLACVAPAYALSVTRVGRRGRQLLGPLLGLQFAAMAVGATSEGFYVLKENAWTDNSLALALRTFPLLAGWLLLMAVVGHLATRVWEERSSRSHTPALQE